MASRSLTRIPKAELLTSVGQENLFAQTLAKHVFFILPSIIKKRCLGCNGIGSVSRTDHIVCCMMSEKDLVAVCFADALKAVDLQQVKLYYQCAIPSYIFPRPHFLSEDAWYERLWTDRDWLELVRDKVVRLQQADI